MYIPYAVMIFVEQYTWDTSILILEKNVTIENQHFKHSKYQVNIGKGGILNSDWGRVGYFAFGMAHNLRHSESEVCLKYRPPQLFVKNETPLEIIHSKVGVNEAPNKTMSAIQPKNIQHCLWVVVPALGKAREKPVIFIRFFLKMSTFSQIRK